MRKWMLVMVVTIGWVAVGDQGCKAPDSVKKAAELVNSLFTGKSIECDNGNSFSNVSKYICQGNKYIENNLDQLTKTRDGKFVLVLGELVEENGSVVGYEVVYPDVESFKRGDRPASRDPSNFKKISDKTIMFYSSAEPKEEEWISTLWFLMPDGSTKGYKMYADRVATCVSKK